MVDGVKKRTNVEFAGVELAQVAGVELPGPVAGMGAGSRGNTACKAGRQALLTRRASYSFADAF